MPARIATPSPYYKNDLTPSEKTPVSPYANAEGHETILNYIRDSRHYIDIDHSAHLDPEKRSSGFAFIPHLTVHAPNR